MEITQYTGGTLLTAPKMAAGVETGIADIGLSHCSYSRGRFPVMEIMELPLGFPSAWIAATWRTTSMTSSSRRSGIPIIPSSSVRAP